MDNARVLVCYVTFPDEETGKRVARALVSEELAACVNLLPGVRSIYRWKGEICDEGEVLGIVKTTEDRFERLRRRVVELHPYEVPEVIAFPVAHGHEPYLNWVRIEVTPDGC